ncbi:DNA polymerase/3'-5' exonuclease PolX [Rhodopirellula sp. MGV]|uniref:DNA polymerase/3'-5' exonuclease PolX n=1 Tax=Rhodopirellula sp. MGV TaxID=2023130 RepID=UPI000B95EB72|nr:DNA polymerase/3'-5' exonuclease PolX [Rhodopirellula sp. MGV]OYP29859.1 DNA polymerase III subunit beta [Rhodopirellula sp. MGV]PNY33741.1 DNA polymerase/3'-5' exonuclease PolX [Rhodopirellula baltica]
MDNSGIAAVFEELAELLEFKGENPFRIRAYKQGARAIRDLDESVADIVADPDRKLSDLPGIGKTLADKTEVLLESGELPQLAKLRAEVPEVMIQISRIPGLGAKKAAMLQKELSIESLDDLRKACEDGSVAKLKGFGKKTSESILEGLSIAEQAAERIYWSAGDDLANSISKHMKGCRGIEKLEWAGSYRRGRETVGDLDLLVVAKDRDAAMDHLETYPEKSQTIGRGETKISIRVGKAFQVDMRCVDAHQFGAALQYFTGSQAHNIHTRRIAKEKGLKINEYGVFKLDDDQQVAGETEQDVYAAIGLPWIPPELREDRLEFKAAEKDSLPELIETSDVRGDLHMHTTATDGQNTIREMADAAIERGLKYIAITDHSQRVSMAMGLTPDRLREQWKAIDEIRPEYEGRLEILKGIECDILEAGGMDLPDDVLAEADWVLASVHYGQRQSREQITERILGAIENEHVDCIAHPTGRLINRRPPYEVDMDAVMKAVAKAKKLMELNANPARLDLNEIHLAAAKKLGIPIVISTDAHNIHGLDVMQYGIKQARRGGLTKADVANTKTFKQFQKLL